MSNTYRINANLRFNVNTASIQPVITSLKRALAGQRFDLPVNLKIDQTALRNLSSQNAQLKTLQTQLRGVSTATQSIGTSAKGAAREMASLYESLGLAARRFTTFAIAASTIAGLVVQTGQAVKAALEFDRELVRLKQVGGDSKLVIDDLAKTVTKLSTSLGASSSDLIKAAVTFRQAGYSVDKVKQSVEALAKTTLSPTFESITSTTEGMIAIMEQFGVEGKNIEKVLGSLSKVSADYAVESTDLIEAVKRSGAAFQAAGGNVNELFAIFTSIRATTRESAESISTGLRTILARLQDPAINKSLRQMGINLYDLKGQFVGPMEAAKRLHDALQNISPQDMRFAEVLKDIGGIRNLSRALPLITQVGLAQKAYRSALAGESALTKDAIIAQESFLNSVDKLKESFLELFRVIANDSTIRSYMNGIVGFLNIITIALKEIKPLIPVIATLGALKLGVGLANGGINQFARGFTNVRTLAEGGPVGNNGSFGVTRGTDSQPALLTPGEFVLNKNAVRSIGVSNLMHWNTHASGGLQTRGGLSYGITELQELLNKIGVNVNVSDYVNNIKRRESKDYSSGSFRRNEREITVRKGGLPTLLHELGHAIDAGPVIGQRGYISDVPNTLHNQISQQYINEPFLRNTRSSIGGGALRKYHKSDYNREAFANSFASYVSSKMKDAGMKVRPGVISNPGINAQLESIFGARRPDPFSELASGLNTFAGNGSSTPPNIPSVASAASGPNPPGRGFNIVPESKNFNRLTRSEFRSGFEFGKDFLRSREARQAYISARGSSVSQAMGYFNNNGLSNAPQTRRAFQGMTSQIKDRDYGDSFAKYFNNINKNTKTLSDGFSKTAQTLSQANRASSSISTQTKRGGISGSLKDKAGIIAIASALALPAIINHVSGDKPGYAGSILSGAATGALYGGSMGAIGGPWGIGIGAALGAGIGGASSFYSTRSEINNENAMNKAKQVQYLQSTVKFDKFGRVSTPQNFSGAASLMLPELSEIRKREYEDNESQLSTWQRWNTKDVRDQYLRPRIANNLTALEVYGTQEEKGNVSNYVLDTLKKRVDQLQPSRVPELDKYNHYTGKIKTVYQSADEILEKTPDIRSGTYGKISAAQALRLDPTKEQEFRDYVKSITEGKTTQDRLNEIEAQAVTEWSITIDELETLSSRLHNASELFGTRSKYIEQLGGAFQGQVVAGPSNVNLGNLGGKGTITGDVYDFGRAGGGYDQAKQALSHIIGQVQRTPEGIGEDNIALTAGTAFREHGPKGRFNSVIASQLEQALSNPETQQKIRLGGGGAVVDQILQQLHPIKQANDQNQQILQGAYSQYQNQRVGLLNRKLGLDQTIGSRFNEAGNIIGQTNATTSSALSPFGAYAGVTVIGGKYGTKSIHEEFVSPEQIASRENAAAKSAGFKLMQEQLLGTGLGGATSEQLEKAIGIRAGKTASLQAQKQAAIENHAPLEKIAELDKMIDQSNDAISRMVQGMNNLANSTIKLEYAQSELAEVAGRMRQDSEARQGVAKTIAFGSRQEQMQLFQREAMVNAATQLNPMQFQALPDQVRAAIGEHLEQTKGLQRMIPTFDNRGRFIGNQMRSGQDIQNHLMGVGNAIAANPLAQQKLRDNLNNAANAVLLEQKKLLDAQIRQNAVQQRQIASQTAATIDSFRSLIQDLDNGLADQIAATQNFLDSSAALTNAMKGFPSKLQIERNGKIEVVLNGAQVMEAIKGDLEIELWKQIESRMGEEIKKAIARLPRR
jgi:TP901 family phage tail tape measure protein